MLSGHQCRTTTGYNVTAQSRKSGQHKSANLCQSQASSERVWITCRAFLPTLNLTLAC
jgi:hypothetical protein